MKQFLDTITGFLGIERPYLVCFAKTLDDDNAAAQYWATYQGKTLLTHHVHISLEEDGRDIQQRIAHEFVHAWQEENGYGLKPFFHGAEFKYVAKYLRQYLLSNGYPNLGKLYLRNYDVT